MNTCHAVLLDTVSIQNYIFQSNKLKENLGASHLVREIYRRYLACALSKVTGRTFEYEKNHLDDWKKPNSGDRPDCSKPVDIGYIGGGNALLFFQDWDKAQKFIKEWTKILLIHAPGLTTAVADNAFPQNPEKFQSSLKALFRLLEKNKAKYSPITSLPRHGITAECARSGVSAEIYNKDISEHVSANVNARIEAAAESKDEIENEYQVHLQGKYCFPDELDKLGGIEGEDSHIAIVHIDGNDIGQRFKDAKNLKAIRRLAVDVDKTTRFAFEAVVKTATQKYDEIMDSLGFDSHLHPKLGGKKILPIRPIILGGDDVTFVCDGKLGIYFAKMFIEEFEKASKRIMVNNEKLTACASVAIIKTKYPFYRGYWLAEELCKNAKRKRKRDVEWSEASVLDFHVSLGGISGSLDKIRQQYYGRDDSQDGKKTQVDLLYRPFKIAPKDPLDEYGLDMFLEKARQLDDEEHGLPKNKRHELREVLRLPEDARREYVRALEYRGRSLPEIKGRQFHKTLVENNETPYFDMIELLRFYPEFALKEIVDKS